jgi:hypothetical protein
MGYTGYGVQQIFLFNVVSYEHKAERRGWDLIVLLFIFFDIYNTQIHTQSPVLVRVVRQFFDAP